MDGMARRIGDCVWCGMRKDFTDFGDMIRIQWQNEFHDTHQKCAMAMIYKALYAKELMDILEKLK